MRRHVSLGGRSGPLSLQLACGMKVLEDSRGLLLMSILSLRQHPHLDLGRLLA